MRGLFHQPYLGAYETSIQISLNTALVGGAARARDRLRGDPRGHAALGARLFTTFSGVAANFGGIPLAFAFIATSARSAIVTKFLAQHSTGHYRHLRHGIHAVLGFGVGFVYLYFQIPLMILVIAPAIDGLRREWREAAANLGASSWQYWRNVGIPVLAPSFLGAMILLFGNAFAAYATAYA